jgi:hypothetical protein
MLILDLELIPISRNAHFCSESLSALANCFFNLQLYVINENAQVTFLQLMNRKVIRLILTLEHIF